MEGEETQEGSAEEPEEVVVDPATVHELATRGDDDTLAILLKVSWHSDSTPEMRKYELTILIIYLFIVINSYKPLHKIKTNSTPSGVQ